MTVGPWRLKLPTAKAKLTQHAFRSTTSAATQRSSARVSMSRQSALRAFPLLPCSHSPLAERTCDAVMGKVTPTAAFALSAQAVRRKAPSNVRGSSLGAVPSGPPINPPHVEIRQHVGKSGAPRIA